MSDDDKGKLIPLPGGATPDAIANALRDMKKNIPALIEYWQIDAKIKRAKYLALREQGFTEAEALTLTKDR